MSRHTKITDKAWAKYMFNVMDNLTREQLDNLDESYHKYMVNDRVMLKWTENANLEDQLIFLSQVGIRFSLITHQEKAEHQLIRENVHKEEKYAEKRLQVIKEMEADRVFVIGSESVMLNLHISSMNSHHKAYIFNHKFETLMKGYKGRDMKMVEKMEEIKKGTDVLAALSIGSLAIMNKCDILFGVTTKKMKVLIAAYRYRTDFVSRETLIEDLGKEDSLYSFTKICGNMASEGYLIRHPYRKHTDKMYNHYNISEKGIETVMKLFKYILDSLGK